MNYIQLCVFIGLLALSTPALAGHPTQPRDVIVSDASDLDAIEADPLLKAIVSLGCYANFSPDVKIVRELLRIEAVAGITGPARGIMAAAACNESGFGPEAMGDWVDLKTGHRCANGTAGCVPTSYGMVQQKNWVKKKLRRLGAQGRIPQFDWKVAVRYWGEHLVRQRAKVKAYCGYQGELDIWRSSHRTSITKPKCGRWKVGKDGKQRCRKRIPYCHQIGAKYKSSHWRILNAWQKLSKSNPAQVALVEDPEATRKVIGGKSYPLAVNP